MQDSEVPPIPPVPSGLGSLAIYLQQGREAGLAVKRDKTGAISFLVVPRGRLGLRQSRSQAFPMTDDGWCKAWSAFREKDATAAHALASSLALAAPSRAARQRLHELVAEKSFLTIPSAILVAGYRTEPLAVGTSHLVQFLPDEVRVVERPSAQISLHARYEDLIALSVDGDNRSDSRLTGGQLALAAAAEGILTAALMSSIASRGAATYVEMQTVTFHGVFVVTDRTVSQVRLALKPVQARLRLIERDAQQHAAVADDDLLSRLERLQALQQQGILTSAEFEAAKRRILD